VARSRAETSAMKLAPEAVSWITPLKVSGRPSRSRSQSVVTCSSSVKAGLACQLRPMTARPVLSMSPRTAESEPAVGK
jgi:hypothetical protein